MSRKDKFTVAVVVGIVAVLTGGIVALSQPPGPVGEGPGMPMKMNAERPRVDVVRGRVVAKDEQRRGIKVEGGAPWAKGELGAAPVAPAATWVAFRPQTVVRRVAEVGLGEIRLGDEISVQGLPAAIDARRVVVGEFPGFSPEGGPAGPFPSEGPPPGVGKEVSPPSAPGPVAKPGPGMPGRRLGGGGVFASARGKVVNLQPLTIECQVPVPPPAPFTTAEPGAPLPLPELQTVRITVAVDQNTRVLKIVDSSFEDIHMGEETFAVGQSQRGVLLARLAVVGVQLEGFLPGLGGFGGGGGPGGMFKFGGENPWE